MRGLKVSTLAATVLVLSACYHATITTGRQPSGQQYEVPWAHSFIYGIVPPATVEAASRCPNGVAQVETQHSFLNGLVAVITWGIYTPMTITVSCAGGGPVPDAEPVTVADGASMTELAQAFDAAAKRAIDERTIVRVEFGSLEK